MHGVGGQGDLRHRVAYGVQGLVLRGGHLALHIQAQCLVSGDVHRPELGDEGCIGKKVVYVDIRCPDGPHQCLVGENALYVELAGGDGLVHKRTVEFQSYAYKLSSDAPWAQDATQHVFMIVIDKIEKFSKMNDDEIAAYCFTIVKNYFYRFSKSRSMEVDFELSESDLKNAVDNDPAQETLFRELEYEEVKLALRSLTERQQMIIALKYGLKRTHSEIAEEMGISESYSQNLLAAAVKELRKKLGESNINEK